jgi:hypothetical protein
MDGLKNIIAKRVDSMKADAVKRRRWSHSSVHELADQISRAYGEPKLFRAYLGIIGKIGEVRARSVYGEISESKCDNPRKLFFWKCHEVYMLDHPEPAAKAKRPKKIKPPKQLPLI